MIQICNIPYDHFLREILYFFNWRLARSENTVGKEALFIKRKNALDFNYGVSISNIKIALVTIYAFLSINSLSGSKKSEYLTMKTPFNYSVSV